MPEDYHHVQRPAGNHPLGMNVDSRGAYESAVNKVIEGVGVVDNDLFIKFTDGSALVVADDGQTCCEHRFMSTDDELSYFSGAIFAGLELREAPNMEDPDGEAHEVCLLEVNTSKGSFTVVNHNQHNGYYGGFSIECRMRSKEEM